MHRAFEENRTCRIHLMLSSHRPNLSLVSDRTNETKEYRVETTNFFMRPLLLHSCPLTPSSHLGINMTRQPMLSYDRREEHQGGQVQRLKEAISETRAIFEKEREPDDFARHCVQPSVKRIDWIYPIKRRDG